MVAYPVETDHQEAKHVTEDFGPQLEDKPRYLLRRHIGRHVGHPDVEDQQRHDDSEDGIGEEDKALQLPGTAPSWHQTPPYSPNPKSSRHRDRRGARTAARSVALSPPLSRQASIVPTLHGAKSRRYGETIGAVFDGALEPFVACHERLCYTSRAGSNSATYFSGIFLDLPWFQG
jgi:hypothetical protein